MKVLGLVVEYNPFHNGHFYHLHESKKITGADFVICVMSGNFIQRGEPAIINKWARAKTALLSGADLVIELPLVYAMSSAEFFAYGAVKILDSTGIVSHLCFGSENGRIEVLDSIAEILYQEPAPYRFLLKENLNQGKSFPASRGAALKQYISSRMEHSPYELGTLLESSNNILGIEYLKALKRLGSKITPFTIKRIQNEYHSESLTSHISSATSIRKHVVDHLDTPLDRVIRNVVPKESLDILKDEFLQGRGPVFASHFNDIILSHLRRLDTEEVKLLPFVSEGLENRIKNSANTSGSLHELIESIATKRYTKTRIQRSLFHTLTGLTSIESDKFMEYGGPQYIRVLGFNHNGKHLLSKINKTASLPVIIKSADFKNSCNPLLRRMLEIEAFSTDMYVLGYQNPLHKKAGQEFTQNVIRILPSSLPFH